MLVELREKELPSRVRSPAFLMEKIMLINYEQLRYAETFDGVTVSTEVARQYREVVERYQKENIMSVEYIRDRKQVKEAIEKKLNQYKDTIKYSYVEKVKIRNRFLKKDQIIRDLYFVATSESSNKPMCITAMRINDKFYILHDDITHWNMDSGTNRYLMPEGTSLFYRSFCNPVLMKHIWDSPENASKFLLGTLSEGNPNDRYRTPNSLDVEMYIPPKMYGSSIMNNKCTLQQIILNRYDVSNLSRDDKIYLKSFEKDLKDKNKCYTLYGDLNSFPINFTWGVINKKDIGKKYITSGYYKVYDIDDMEEIGEIPKEEIDVCCVGCGSAGSNIIDQVARTEFSKKYLLIDFDRVEAKNIRNQTYTLANIGSPKVNALRNMIQNRTRCPVDDINDKYENVNFNIYKFKYLISGFDTIECRLGLLQKIKDKEIETDYLIDTRYDELNSSLYFIDTSNSSEMEYYEKLLKADEEEFKNNKDAQPKETTEWSLSEAAEYVEQHLIHGTCSMVASRLGIGTRNICLCEDNDQYDCGSPACALCVKRVLEKNNVKHEIDDNSCQHVNIIHIYKLTSSWVTSIMRGIETDEKKPVTHVEITADPIPNAIVIKK